LLPLHSAAARQATNCTSYPPTLYLFVFYQ
jgi:hypothetical protein